MISYEIAMGLSTIPVLILAGNVSLNQIVQQQATAGWNVLLATVASITFLISAFAETNRLPFDMAEAESELIAATTKMNQAIVRLRTFHSPDACCCTIVRALSRKSGPG